ncbi:YqcI/YcgG family protein [Neobacillus sp. NRS-1170]|uniref:YqcI/YcgG family protein n=1 Tax=Neobacillus sp. NRS-1170 TaxID=3233898 RepID=UPI003D2E7240
MRGGSLVSIYTKETLQQMALEHWQKDAMEKFEAKMTDKSKPFPCIPATQGYQLHHFRYGFIRNSNAKQLADMLEAYSNCFREIGSYTSLIIFYEPRRELLEKTPVEKFELLFWKQLNLVQEFDQVKWPNHIPQDPHDSLWEFCYHGEQYFIFCATPSHKNRLSRHFPYFMLAITPRFVLEQFSSSESKAAKIKASIRKRLSEYDTIAIHPNLNTYGKNDNYEWKQYFLHDDDTTLSRCPFHSVIKTSKD